MTKIHFLFLSLEALICLEIEPTSVKDISELFENSDTPEDSQLDFSKIPDLHAQIFQLLDENPVFYSKDFKSILDNIYKSMARFSKKRCENYTRQGWGTYEWYVKVDFDYDNFKGSEDEYVDWLEEIFLKRQQTGPVPSPMKLCFLDFSQNLAKATSPNSTRTSDS